MTCNRCVGERLIADMEHTCSHAEARVSDEFDLLNAQTSHDKVCKQLDRANDLIERLYASGRLDEDQAEAVRTYLGLGI